MAIDTGARELTIRATPAPGRVRLSVGGLLRHPAREAAFETALGRLPNVRQVRASSLTGNVLIVFDPDAWTTDDLVTAAALELGYTVRDERDVASLVNGRVTEEFGTRRAV